MPLVRIIGELVNVPDLMHHLRESGFDVATTADGASPGAAELEITIEECSAEEALRRVLSLAEGKDLSILVSPGTVAPVPVADAAAVPAELPLQQSSTPQEEPFEQPAKVSPSTAAVPELPGESVAELFRWQGLIQPTLSEPNLQADSEECTAVPESNPNLPAESAPSSDGMPGGIDQEPVVAFQSSGENASDWPFWELAREVAQPEKNLFPEVSTYGSSTIQVRTAVAHFAALRIWRKKIFTSPAFTTVLQNERLFGRVALAAAGTAIILLLYGAMAHRFPPLPSRILHNSSKAQLAAPFQKPRMIRASTAEAVVPPTPAVWTTPTPASPGLVKAPAIRKQFVGRHHSSSEADYVAKNTVVRYRQSAASTQPRNDSRDQGIKYYTDLKPGTR
jgi:hypothetical protein